MTDLRNRLTTERAALLGELETGGHLAPGFLRLLGDVQLALQALDGERADHSESMPARVLVRDVPGELLALMLFHGDDAPMRVDLLPLRALALSADLTEGARRRLAGGGVS